MKKPRGGETPGAVVNERLVPMTGCKLPIKSTGRKPNDVRPLIASAPYAGDLRFGEIELPCFVLDDGLSVLTASGITKVFASSKAGNLEGFVEAISPGSFEKLASSKIRFRLPGNNAIAEGYPADVLIDVCTLYVKALATGKLHPKQVPLAVRASVVITACAKAGINAAVWEATGYDKIKAHGALQDKLAIALRQEAGKYQRLFTPEFFSELARLFHLTLGDDGRRPWCFAAFLREFFYEWFDADVYEELRARNPRPTDGTKHHQFLTDYARGRFEQHQRDVLLLLRTSASVPDFRMRFNAVFRGAGLQLSFGGAQ